MDEKGLIIGKSPRVKVICVRGRKSPPLLTDGNRELITVIKTVSTSGRYLPPMIIYKSKSRQAQWHMHLNAEDRETVFCVSSKGWTNQILGVEYLKLLFKPHTTRDDVPEGRPWHRLLIVDDHNSHFSTEFLTFCSEHNI